ncbi:MAG: hypothetical protein ABWX65_01880 [Mycetocola sp.]
MSKEVHPEQAVAVIIMGVFAIGLGIWGFFASPPGAVSRLSGIPMVVLTPACVLSGVYFIYLGVRGLVRRRRG